MTTQAPTPIALDAHPDPARAPTAPAATSARALPFALRYALVVALCLVPLSAFLAAQFAPSADLPAHLALVRVLERLGDGGALDQHFSFGVLPAPNSLTYGVGLLAGAFGDMADVGVALFFLAPMLVLAGFAALLHAAQRSMLGTLALVPFVVQWPLIEGLVDFYFGMAMFFFAVAALMAWLRRPSPARALVLALTSVLVFAAHVHAILFLGLAVPILLGVHLGRRRPGSIGFRRALAGGALALGPAVALVIVWMLVAHSDSALATGGDLEVGADARFEAFLRKGPLALDGDAGARVVFIGLLALLVHALVARLRPPPPSPVEPAPSRRVDTFLLVFLALCVAALVWVPNNVGSYWTIHLRFVPMIWFVAVALATPLARPLPLLALHRWRSWLVPILAALPLVASALHARAAWSDSVAMWNTYLDGFREVLDRAPRERQAMMVIEPSASARPQGFRAEMWRHFGQYYTALDDGPTTFSFGWHPGRIVRETVRREKYLERGKVADARRIDELGCSDVVLQLGPTDLTTTEPRLTLLHRHGVWAVYAASPACPR